MDNITRAKIFECIRQELNVDPYGIDLDKDLRAEAVLDSMQFVSLLARIEIALNIEIPVSIMEVATLRQFLDAVDALLQPAE